MRMVFNVMLGVLATMGVIFLAIQLFTALFSWSYSTGSVEIREEQEYDSYLESLALRGHSRASPQWTPNGAQIVFGHWPRVYVVDTSGSELREVSFDNPEGHWAHSPTLSPDGASVVFITTDPSIGRSSSELVATDLDGPGKRMLTHNDVWDLHPTWSPNGTRIAFVSDSKVHTMALDGSDTQRVSDSIWVEYSPPVWSGTGHGLAFLSEGEEVRTDCLADQRYLVVKGTLYVARADGSDTRLVQTEPVSGPVIPTWSPDGRRIILPVLSEEDCEYSEMLSVAQDGSASNPIILYPRWFGDTDASWSPDGSIIVMGSTLVRVDRSEARSVPVPRGHSSWSPDGSRIAVHVPRYAPGASWAGYGGPAVLYTMAADGSDIRVLVEQDEGGNLSAAKGRPLNYSPTQAEQRQQCLEFAEPGVLKYCEEE